MKIAMNRRWMGLAGALGGLALLGGCVATGPVGYDDYNYGYGSPGHVDIDVYSTPGYHTYPQPYYGQPGYDRRYDRRPPPPRAVLPVPPHPGLRPPPPVRPAPPVVTRPMPPAPQVRPPVVRPMPPTPQMRPPVARPEPRGPVINRGVLMHPRATNDPRLVPEDEGNRP